MSHKRKFKLKPIQKEFDRIRKGYVLLLIVPLAIQIVIFKIIKFSILETEGSLSRSFDNFLGHLLLQHAPLPLLLALASTVVGLLLFTRFTPLGVVFLPLVLALTGGAGLSLNLVLDSIPLWISWEFLEVIRIDLVVVLLLAAVYLPGLRYLNGRALSVFIVFMHVLTAAIGCVAAFEFGYFVETGSLADSYLLIYSLKHAGNVATVLAHEMNATKAALLALPVVLTILPVVYRWIMRSTKRITRFDVHKKAIPLNAPLLFCTAAFGLFLPAIPVHSGLSPIRNNIVVDLIHSLYESTAVVGVDAGQDPESRFGIPTKPISFVPVVLAKDGSEDVDAGETRAPETSKENLIIIILESTRASATSLYDSTMGTTPFLASLAERGFVVEDMSAVVPHTNKAMIPILCGVYPKISQDESQLAEGTNCLPSLLEPYGYETAFFTPASLEFENKRRLLKQIGFAEVYGDGEFDGSGYALVNYFGREDQIVVDPIIDWVTKRHDADKPFFLSYLSLTPHHDYTVPDRHTVVEFDPADKARNDYLNTLAYQDSILEQLFAGFETAGILETTNFIIVGDHGEAFGEHGLRFHSSVMWQEVLHVPAVVLTPSNSAGTIEGPRQQQDILQTSAELLGYRIDGENLPGLSLLDSAAVDRSLYMAGWTENQSMALRDGDHKFIYGFERTPAEYYDLANDPGEKNDLVDSLGASSKRALEMRLLQWRSAVNDDYSSRVMSSSQKQN